MVNPFEQLADRQINSPTRARLRAAEKRAAKQPMVPTEQEKKLNDQTKQFRSYRRWKRQQVKERLAEPYPEGFSELRRILRSLTIDNPAALVDYIAGAAWLHKASHEARAIAMEVISDAITRLRIQNGFAPFDDALPGEEPTVHDLILARLDTFSKPTEQP